MKYIINYNDKGRILGFYNEEQPSNLNIKVDNQTWFNNMGMTKIIIDKDKNITFEKVDWKTPEEIVQEVELKQKEERKNLMLQGSIYNGYRISFTKDDGDGVVQVKSAFEMGLSSTVIHFECGTNMPINADEFNEFGLWFVIERNKFF